jgi:predicted DCC family thiol-disulfide oxidoreductase YuxK
MLSERRSGLAESLWRACFGAWLFVQFASSAWPRGGALRPLDALGLLATLLLALGWRDRPAAALLAVLWWLRPLDPDPWRSDWIVIALLFAEVALPAAPYGSLSVRGRADPAGGWSMPGWILRLRFAALFALGPCVLFWTRALESAAWRALRTRDGDGGRELAGCACAFLAFLLHERALGWAWLAFLVAAIATSFGPIQGGSRELLWLALAANFQPGWFPPRRASGAEFIFYDGTCALCHGFVRFVLSEDAQGTAFRFAPIDSAALRAAIPETERARLPDSIVVRTCDGQVLVRSNAVLHVMGRLGGWWRLSAEILRFVPRPLRDLAYSCVAAVRKRVFGTKSDACPLLPRHLRSRFET